MPGASSPLGVFGHNEDQVPQSRKEIVSWVGSQVLPHEGQARAWLRRFVSSSTDIDDVLQEAYCRIAALESVAHIQSGKAYLFQTVRHIALEHLRRSRIVRIDSVTDVELLHIPDEGPSLERITAGARQLKHVQGLIEALPPRCREAFILRRIHGVPQKEIARELGISEATVEMHAARGLKLILKALAGEARVPERERDETDARSGHGAEP